MIADIEALMTTYLAADGDVAAVVGEEIVGTTPEDTTAPWVRITQLAAADDYVDHLIGYTVQFDCYAGADNDQADAVDLGRLVRAAIKTAHESAHSGAVITGAAIVGDARLPDPDFEPARERRILTATIWGHAT